MVKYIKTFLARLRCCSRQLENLFFQHVQKKHIFDLLRSFYSFISPKRILFFVRRLFAFGVLSSIWKSFLKKQLKFQKESIRKLKHVKIWKCKTKIAKKYYMVKYKKTFLARLRCSSRQLEIFFLTCSVKAYLWSFTVILQFHLSKENLIFCSATFAFVV